MAGKRAKGGATQVMDILTGDNGDATQEPEVHSGGQTGKDPDVVVMDSEALTMRRIEDADSNEL